MICESTDFMFPMQADIFYPVVEQGTYGNVKKTWIQDRTVAVNFSSAGNAGKEEVKPNVNITQDTILIVTNVLITNIKDRNCNEVYIETSGPRAGKSTIFEIATQEPFLGPFGNVEYYNLVIRRSENQAVDV
jgi:hypothetical protein